MEPKTREGTSHIKINNNKKTKVVVYNTDRNVQKHNISLGDFSCGFGTSFPILFQWLSSMGSYFMGQKITALPRWVLKLKLVQRFAHFFFSLGKHHSKLIFL